MTVTVKARGIPQHVVDKLDLPVLPDTYFWRLWQPYRWDYGGHKTKTEMALPIELRRDGKRWFNAQRTIVSSGERVWEPTNETLVDAFQRGAHALYAIFVDKYAAQLQIDELWRKS